MKDIKFVPCRTDEDIKKVAQLADEIWHEYFVELIGIEQVNYMVDKFQSLKAMQEQVKHEKYHYVQICDGNELIGYIGLQFQPDRMFLSKLYIRQDHRNEHIASKAFEYIKEIAKRYCYREIYLTCNKQNKHSLDVYDHWGFKCVEDVVTDIGNGFVMDDHVLEYVIKAE